MRKEIKQKRIIIFSDLGPQRFGLYHPRENNSRVYFRL